MTGGGRRRQGALTVLKALMTLKALGALRALGVLRAVAGRCPARRYPGAVTDAPSPATPPRPGLLISFEGGDGVGKTTQIERLATALAAARIGYRRTREPGGTELGAEIRRLLLHGGAVDPRAEALLYAADRAQHVAEVIRPALERGEVVLTDRYLDSSIAYQGAARSLGTAEVRRLSEWATDSLLPDLTILLDADPSVADRRTGDRGAKDRLESEGMAFRAALREQFLALADAEPSRFAVIDARLTIEEVARAVDERVAALLAERPGAVALEVDARAGDATGPDARAAFLQAVARLEHTAGEGS